MSISSIQNDNNFRFEDRKLKIQRREMAQAYKKANIFVDTSKNPTIKLIEDLLQTKGNMPKELMDSSKKAVSEMNQAQLEIASASEFHDEDFEPNNLNSFQRDEVWQDDKFDQQAKDLNLKNYESHLSPNQIMPFTFEDVSIVVPEISNHYFDRNEMEARNSYIKSKFQKAISTYKNQMLLAEDGFLLIQPQISITA